MEDMAPFTDDFARNLYVFSWINTMAMLNNHIYIIIYIYLEPSFDPSLGWLTFNFMSQNLDIPWVKTGFQRTVGYIAWRWRTVDDIQIGFMDVHRGRWRCFFNTSYQRNLENWKTWGIIESWLAVHIYVYIYNYIYTIIYIMCVLFLLAFTLI
jgi:hypothetical protein